MKNKTLTRRLFIKISAVTVGAIIIGRKFFNWSEHEAGFTELASSVPHPINPEDPVVSAAIYPAFGVARVGNSVEAGNDFFDGPEIDTPLYLKNIKSRDSRGALKRQAQRFRIYGKTKSGKTIELTADNAAIQWGVRLANKKANWYRFDVALDIEEAKKNQVQFDLRNATVADRKSLMVAPPTKYISGKSKSGDDFYFDSGTFMNIPVRLGELRTDEKGRLRVLGGMGKAGTPDPARYPIFNEKEMQTFNNADGWYDDTSDGPVHARVKIGEQEIPVTGAWVIVAPPNYAPDLIGFRTMYDLMLNIFLSQKPEWIPQQALEHQKTSFTQHILPLFKRLSNLQWVNQGFSESFNFLSQFNFEDPALLKQLASNTAARLPMRTKVFNLFRVPELTPDKSKNHKLWPMLYGDAYGTFDDSEKTQFFVTDHHLRHLKNWMKGAFANDYNPAARQPQSIDEIPIQKQPDMLTKAALDFCLADAFHPGCEVTWPLRHLSSYSGAFRINEQTNIDEKDPSPHLSVNDIENPAGPLQKQSAGDLTRWMALPWHGDTAFCRSGYEPQIDPFLPTFWPARVPNQVLTEEAYQIVTNVSLPLETRKQAFKNRAHWLRVLKGGAAAQMIQMVKNFADVGIVEARPGPADGKFPAVLLVENLGKSFKQSLARGESVPSLANGTPRGGIKGADNAQSEALEKAGWESAEQLESFRSIRFGRKKPR